MRVRLLDYGKEVGIRRRVINWKRHEAFDEVTMFNDLGLLLLDESMPKEAVVPVALAEDGRAGVQSEGNVTVAGWGSTGEQCEEFDTILRSDTVSLGDDGADCRVPGSRLLMSSQRYDVARQLCAGYFDPRSARHGSCGDSGGPLLAWGGEGRAWTQLGVLSWRYKSKYPDVYTRVSAYRGWIQGTSAALLSEGRSRFA